MHMHDTVYESCVMHMYMCIQTFPKKYCTIHVALCVCVSKRVPFCARARLVGRLHSLPRVRFRGGPADAPHDAARARALCTAYSFGRLSTLPATALLARPS